MSYLGSVRFLLCDPLAKVHNNDGYDDLCGCISRYNHKNRGLNIVSNAYWSSTTVAFDSSYAWDVNFNNGNDNWNDKSNSYYVRCVRAGE